MTITIELDNGKVILRDSEYIHYLQIEINVYDVNKVKGGWPFPQQRAFGFIVDDNFLDIMSDPESAIEYSVSSFLWYTPFDAKLK